MEAAISSGHDPERRDDGEGDGRPADKTKAGTKVPAYVLLGVTREELRAA